MKKRVHVIVGVHITNRVKHAGDVQKVLTGFGKHIRTRIGLHDIDEDADKTNGLILLEVVGDAADGKSLAKALKKIKGVQAKVTFFTHP